MSQIPTQEWASIEAAIDSCSACLSDEVFKISKNPPTRPTCPNGTGCILFLSEAPPSSGGFWMSDNPDNLRDKLLPLLGIQTSPPTEALRSFVGKQFFLLQTIKWPLVKTFNHLGPKQQRRLIEHSVKEHLGTEIKSLKPKRILAMGKAAWLSCRFLSAQHTEHKMHIHR